MRRPLLFVPALLALLVAPPVALADPEPEVSDEAPNGWDRFLSVELVGGPDTPWGVLGASFRLAPHENLIFDLGGGGGRDGARFAGGATFSIPDREFAFQVRAGLSGGPLTWGSTVGGASDAGTPTSRPVSRTWDFTAFLDIDLGLEWRHPQGFGGRIFFGVESGLVGGATTCTYSDSMGAENCDPSAGGHPARVYAGIAVSYAFDLLR